MTALKEYVRLETSGLWRATPDAQRREVGISFGEATLVIVDGAGRPLSHWSLPAITRFNPGVRPAVYGPGPDSPETIEIEDDLMIGAIERIRRSVARRESRPGRLRQASVALGVAAVVGIVFLWLPGALMRQTLLAVPPAKRTEIGATILGHLQRTTGITCREPLGNQALGVLYRRVMGRDAPGQIVVVPDGISAPLYLPGAIVVLSRSMIEDAAEPAVVAGHVIIAASNGPASDPLEPVLSGTGMTATLRLLTTGDIPGERLQDYAAEIAARPYPLGGEVDILIRAFDQARIPTTPWAMAVDPAAERLAEMVENDPMAGRSVPPILSDDDWVSLQGVCPQ
jgi:hypothetical protein